jgi:hypothetical protein
MKARVIPDDPDDLRCRLHSSPGLESSDPAESQLKP